MLKTHLQNANECIAALISITKDDIENIKQAKHGAVNDSVAQKNSLIKEFESLKKQIDKELLSLASGKDSQQLSDSLDDETKALLALMKDELARLHSINKEYAKLVIAVKEFFDSLVKEMFGTADDGIYKARA